MPKKHDPKKIEKNWTHQGPRKKMREKNRYTITLPCPHVIQIKEREIHKRSIPFSAIHTCAQS